MHDIATWILTCKKVTDGGTSVERQLTVSVPFIQLILPGKVCSVWQGYAWDVNTTVWSLPLAGIFQGILVAPTFRFKAKQGFIIAVCPDYRLLLARNAICWINGFLCTQIWKVNEAWLLCIVCYCKSFWEWFFWRSYKVAMEDQMMRLIHLAFTLCMKLCFKIT